MATTFLPQFPRLSKGTLTDGKAPACRSPPFLWIYERRKHEFSSTLTIGSQTGRT